MPALLMSITMMQTVAAYREGSNLWPLMLIFAAPLAAVWLFPASFLFPEPWTRYGRLRLRRRSEPPVHRNLGHRLSRARRLSRAQILWQGIGRALLAHRHHAVDRVTPGQCHRRCQPVPVQPPHRMRKKAHRPGLKREAHPGGTVVEAGGAVRDFGPLAGRHRIFRGDHDPRPAPPPQTQRSPSSRRRSTSRVPAPL